MIDYAVCFVAGKQIKVIPGKPFEVELSAEKKLEAGVLLLSEGGKLIIGKPMLKDKLTLEVLEATKGEKIRVAKYSAKANYRRVIGHRSKLTKVVLPVKKGS